MQHSDASILDREVFQGTVRAFEAPLTGLAGSPLAGRFRHWRGTSGRRYLFSVFPLEQLLPGEDAPRFEDAVVLAVGRDAAGERRIFAMDKTGALPDLVYGGSLFRAALAAGADEIHVHLLSNSTAERTALIKDLDAA